MELPKASTIDLLKIANMDELYWLIVGGADAIHLRHDEEIAMLRAEAEQVRVTAEERIAQRESEIMIASSALSKIREMVVDSLRADMPESSTVDMVSALTDQFEDSLNQLNLFRQHNYRTGNPFTQADEITRLQELLTSARSQSEYHQAENRRLSDELATARGYTKPAPVTAEQVRSILREEIVAILRGLIKDKS